MGKYTMSEKVLKVKAEHIKQYNLLTVNQTYYEAFKSKFGDKITSWVQYKVDIGAFMERINRDIATVSISDIEQYVSEAVGKTRNNKTAHIRSLLQYIIKNNIEQAKEKVDKDLLIYLI